MNNQNPVVFRHVGYIDAVIFSKDKVNIRTFLVSSLVVFATGFLSPFTRSIAADVLRVQDKQHQTIQFDKHDINSKVNIRYESIYVSLNKYDILKGTLLEGLSNLPDDIKKEKTIWVNSDIYGRYWGIWAKKHQVVFDLKKKKVLYEYFDDSRRIMVSPHGRYYVLYGPESGVCWDCIPFMSVRRISDSKELISDTSKVGILQFIGDSEKWAKCMHENRSAIVELESGTIAYPKQDNLQNFDTGTEIPGTNLFMGRPMDDRVIVWKMPEMKEEMEYEELAGGYCFASNTGEYVGTYFGNRIQVINRFTNEKYGIGFSYADESLLLKIKRKDNLDKSKRYVEGSDLEVVGEEYIGGVNEASGITDTKHLSGHFGKPRIMKGVPDSIKGIERVFALSNGFAIILSRFDRKDTSKGESRIFITDYKLNIKKILRYQIPLTFDMVLDPSGKYITDINPKDKRQYRVSLK